jgi:hypothetical protein
MDKPNTVLGALANLQNALAKYDAWEAKEKAMRAEAERTGDWRAYDEWLKACK